MGIKEKDLLNLLDAPAVQSKISSICRDIDFSSNTVQSDDTKSRASDKKKIASLEATIEQLNNQLTKCQSDCEYTNAEMQKYKNDSAQLQSKCSDFEAEKNSLENEIIRLKDERENLKIEFGKIEKSLRDYEDENEQLKKIEQDLSFSLTVANNNVKILNERFSRPVILLEHYKSLSASIRTGLSDVICDKNEILFITSCSTPDHLRAIWTYTKKIAGSNGDTDEIEVLKDIFDYFFDVFNNSLREPMYIRDSVETGCLFDDDRYDRCTGSATSGKITQVIMKGYKSINTGKIICRSFVRV